VLKNSRYCPSFEQPGNHLLRRPVSSGNLWLNATFRRVNFNLSGYFTGVAPTAILTASTSGTFVPALASPAIRDTPASISPPATTSAAASLSTAASPTSSDKQYQEAIGFPALGRDFRLGMNYRFNGRN